MTRLLAACGDSPEAHIPIAELRAGLNLSQRELEDDIGLLNLINFGGGCYALYAQIEGDTVVVQKETYGDRFARPARLSPLEAKALLWALDFIGDRLPIEADGSLARCGPRSRRRSARIACRPSSSAAAQVANTGVAAAMSRAIREDRVARDRLLDRVPGSDHQAHHRAAPARQRAGRVVRRRPSAAAPRTSARSASTASAAPSPRSASPADPRSTAGSVPAVGRPPAARRDRRPERLGVVQPAVARWLEEKHRSRERFADGSVLVEIPYASEDWLVKELAQVPGRGRAVRAGRPAADGGGTGGNHPQALPVGTPSVTTYDCLVTPLLVAKTPRTAVPGHGGRGRGSRGVPARQRPRPDRSPRERRAPPSSAARG